MNNIRAKRTCIATASPVLPATPSEQKLPRLLPNIDITNNCRPQIHISTPLNHPSPSSKENPPCMFRHNTVQTLQEQTNNPQKVAKSNELDVKISQLELLDSLDTKSEDVSVIKASIMHNDIDEDYKMSANPRGLCLIINNVDFDNDLLTLRKGSDRDANRFKTIFRDLGFKVTLKRNQTSDKMKDVLRQTAALCKSKHDAVVIILLSHGCESGIYGTDVVEVDLQQIVSYFDNKQCRQLIGKPKIFIVQACRGRLTDYGVRNYTQAFFSQPESQSVSQQTSQIYSNSETPKLPRWSEIDRFSKEPLRTDVLICFSCMSGYVSNRNERAGSWLGVALALYLQKYACKKHLMEILNMVSRNVRARTSSDGLKQALEITSIGFDRNLYFNPGLFGTDTN